MFYLMGAVCQDVTDRLWDKGIDGRGTIGSDLSCTSSKGLGHDSFVCHRWTIQLVSKQGSSDVIRRAELIDFGIVPMAIKGDKTRISLFPTPKTTLETLKKTTLESLTHVFTQKNSSSTISPLRGSGEWFSLIYL